MNLCLYFFTGTLDFNPLTDKLKAADGSDFLLNSPYGDELPQRGFDAGEDTYQAPPADGSAVVVNVNPSSDRLQLLHPFDKWSGEDLTNMRILIKVIILQIHITFCFFLSQYF